jgi:hypothetical protein
VTERRNKKARVCFEAVLSSRGGGWGGGGSGVVVGLGEQTPAAARQRYLECTDRFVSAGVVWWQDQLLLCTNLYVEEQLLMHFGELVTFVKGAEHVLAQQGTPDGPPPPGFGVAEAEPTVRNFTSKWTTSIEVLNRCAIRAGPGPACWSLAPPVVCITQRERLGRREMKRHSCSPGYGDHHRG